MSEYTNTELEKAVHVVDSAISRCEKMQPKFEEGTSQHSLLKNRIKALYISKALIMGSEEIADYTNEELQKALPPVTSIISKTEKAQSKYEEGTITYRRFEPTIRAMYVAKDLLEKELERRKNNDNK